MTDPRTFAAEAVQQLDRLSAVILEDLGDGPKVDALVSAATAARDAVGKLAVPALAQVAGLLSNVAGSLASSAIEWNPAIGGTLMATVDDLRHLAARAGQLSEEDSEHLHHRASELMVYSSASASASASVSASASEPKADTHTHTPTHTPTDVIPISDLFYADNGPHIVSGGTPREATEKSDLLGRGIDALENLTMRPIAKQMTFGSVEVVPVETLLYRGRAALERAAAIREQIKSAGGVASPATLEEMYDLIGLALKD